MIFILITSILVSLCTSASVSDCTNSDKQLLGSTIRREDDVTSLDDCVTLCQAESTCQACVWRSSSERCWLKKCGYGDLSDKTGSDAVEICCLTSVCDTCDDSCETCCTGLDSSWSKAETSTSFSVKVNVTVDVTCEDGYLNEGDSTVTCVSDTTFTGEPDCQKEGIGGWGAILAFLAGLLVLGALGAAVWFCCIKNGQYRKLNRNHQCN
jgi:hypothetical protein